MLSASRLLRPLRLSSQSIFRCALSSQSFASDVLDLKRIRNIGISAHIDSGKTTLTERILYYTGRIDSIHDVRGKDGVGAKMDSMELEREKGITIQSAATFCRWKDNHINIIDTPGHVDFTIEVERALRVLDGAILVLCGVSGVQSQTLTVDRQMKRYNVPRLVFINKLDRVGANPWKVIDGLRKHLGLPATAVQIPIGVEEKHEGVVDLVEMKAIYFEGDMGRDVIYKEVPADMLALATTRRVDMIERLAEVDDEIAEKFLMEEEPTILEIKAAIRRQTIARTFVPVFMGSAYKNRGVQVLLDGVDDYLPSPDEAQNKALDLLDNEKEVPITCDPKEPLIALAFKLEESRFGQLTYLRIYRGTLNKGDTIVNMKTMKKVKVPRVVRMHSNDMEEIGAASGGDVVAVFGVECGSMDTFTDGTCRLGMSSMFVPDPVMSVSVRPKDSGKISNFGKAVGRFCREDPTLRITQDAKTKETIMSGMGELHLDIYIERLKREFDVECITGTPLVNYKETITQRAQFSYLHKKQTGGSGQYARVVGFMDPQDEEDRALGKDVLFESHIVGTAIPSEYIPSCEKGAIAACEKGFLAGHPMVGVRVVITDGQAHMVDSSDIAFQLAMQYGMREAVAKAKSQVLEPIMRLEVVSPSEFQGTIIGMLNKKNGLVLGSDLNEDGSQVEIKAEVPLSLMFGYSTDLRSATQGKGEFSMEYKEHAPVNRQLQEDIIKEYQKRIALENAEK
jgi:elongation factor G